jgi:hypothetical protein
MTLVTTVGVVGIAIGLAACQRTPQPMAVTSPTQPPTVPAAMKQQPSTPLSQIDLTKVGHFVSKGRVQDKDYNPSSPVIDDLISHGKDSIPFLIGKLDDRTLIHYSVEDYWPEMSVGDVAFIILEDFSLDSTWTKETIPGTGFDEIFETKADPKVPAANSYYEQIRKHGRGWAKAKWEKIWTTYKDRIVWDEKERCFKVV